MIVQIGPDIYEPLVDLQISAYDKWRMQFGLSYQDFYHGECSKIGHQKLLCIIEQTIAFEYVPACARLYF